METAASNPSSVMDSVMMVRCLSATSIARSSISTKEIVTTIQEQEVVLRAATLTVTKEKFLHAQEPLVGTSQTSETANATLSSIVQQRAMTVEIVTTKREAAGNLVRRD